MPATAQREETLVRAEKTVLGEIWSSDEPYRNLLHLCDRIGDRWAGSDSERAGGAWLREKAQSYGLRNSRLQEFRHLAWTRGTASLRVVDPVDREVAAIALPYTPAADLEAEAIWVGQGEADDYEKLPVDACRGKIVVSWAESTPPPGGHASHRREKFGHALAAGAIAFLFVNQNAGMMAITGALAAGYEGELPSLGLPRESGDYLRRLLESGPVRLRLAIESSFAEQPSVNVLADVGRQTGAGRGYLLTGAHYDAHDVAVGALDNTAGTVVVLEAARALKQVEDVLPTPVRVVLFACEEVGLLGAWHYAKTAEDLERCRFVLNVDSPVRANPGDESLNLCGFPELVPYFQGIGRDIKYEFEVKDRISAYSDHFPFSVAGVPSGTLGSRPTPGMVGRGWGHTPADTVDKVNPKALQAAAALTARLLLRLAFETEFPGRHRSRAEMAETIDKSPIGWYVRRFGRFPFQPPWA